MHNTMHFAHAVNVIRKVLNLISIFHLKNCKKLLFYSLNTVNFVT